MKVINPAKDLDRVQDAPSPTPNNSGARASIKWTKEEDEKFIAILVQHRGISFLKVQKEYFPNRTLFSLRGRFRVLKEKGQMPSHIQSVRSQDVSNDLIGSENGIPRSVSCGTNEMANDGGTKRLQEADSEFRDDLDPKRRRTLPQRDCRSRRSVNYDLSSENCYREDADDDELQDVDLRGPDRISRILEITNADDFAKIFEKAKRCDVEVKRANIALQEKDEMEGRVRDMEAAMKELRETIGSKKEIGEGQEMSGLQSTGPGYNGIESAWRILHSNARQLFSIKTWQDDGLQALFEKLLEASQGQNQEKGIR